MPAPNAIFIGKPYVDRYAHRPGVWAFVCRELWRVLGWSALHAQGYVYLGREVFQIDLTEGWKWYGGYTPE